MRPVLGVVGGVASFGVFFALSWVTGIPEITLFAFLMSAGVYSSIQESTW